MAKEKIKKVEVADLEIEEKLVVEPVVEETKPESADPVAVFADTIDLTPKVSPTVALAIQQAADRLARDKANFPQM